MVSWGDIVKHYMFTEEDVRNLDAAREVLDPYVPQFTESFYQYLASYPEMGGLFPSKAIVEARANTMARWFTSVLSGKYDNHYIEELRHVGSTHVRREIPIHWVTSSMNFKRQYMSDILRREVPDETKRSRMIDSLNKILDINLDVMTSSYHEEQLKKIFLTERLDSTLIGFADRFAYGLNLLLVLALIGLSIGVTALFVTDIYRLINSPDLVTGIVTALGTLLIIWMIVELLGTEIRYLKGDSFRVEVFVAVALVSMIRELMISTLSHESTETIGLLLAAALILGLVYYLIVRSGSTRNSR